MRRLVLALWITFVVTPAYGASLPTFIFKPAGEGPFPTIILLHDCRGLFQNMPMLDTYVQHYLKQGYAVAIPDSFLNRPHTNVCANREEIPYQTQAEDAYQTLDHLIVSNVAIPSKVFVLDFSGARIVLQIDQLKVQHVEHFAGAIGVTELPTATSLRRVDSYISKAMDSE